MNFQVENFERLRAALHEFDEYLRQCGVEDECIFDSHLVLSELAANVLQHSRCAADIFGDLAGDTIEVEVRSAEGYVPPEKTVLPESSAERGRGLYLIDMLSERRYITSEGGIKVVLRTQYKEKK